MKVIRPFSKEFDNKISDLYQELSKIVTRKIRNEDAIFFNWKYIWGIENDWFDEHIRVWLLDSKYEKQFIEICKKYDVDELQLFYR